MELVVALIVTLVTAPIVRRIAIRLRIVDRPGPLKTHRAAVPYLGGVAVFFGLLVGPIQADRLLLLVPYALALALGVIDDVRGLTPQTRLGAEILVGVVAALAVPGPPLVKLGTAVLVIVLLNAVNLLDGQDGLAAGACLVSAAGFAILGGDATTIGLALAGALAAFLVFNAPPARMYLGDGGAYLLGTVLATLPALTDSGTSDWSVWIAAPLIVGLALTDTAIAVLRRSRARLPLFAGDTGGREKIRQDADGCSRSNRHQARRPRQPSEPPRLAKRPTGSNAEAGHRRRCPRRQRCRHGGAR